METEDTESIERVFDRKIADSGVKIKDIDQIKVRENVFDDVTLHSLYKLVHKGWISVIGGPISTGKEANVFYGERDGKAVAIKIYMIRSANFKRMHTYIVGDRRFQNIRKTRKEVIFAWTKKEFSNLKRAKKAGIIVPEPLVWDRNIMVMEFLGENEVAYPQLRNAVTPKDPRKTYETIILYIKQLYQKAKLVHGDLSEFNILYHDKPYLIDMGQAVGPEHPQALSFLMRDLENINRYFKNMCSVDDVTDIFTDITDIQVIRTK